MKAIIALFMLMPIASLQAESLEEIFSYDVPKTFDVEQYVVRDFTDYIRELRFLRQSFDDPIPFYLAYPKDLTKLKGIVLMLHGITSNKNIWWQDSGPYHLTGEYREKLLEAGYVLILPDAKFHGQRVQAANFESPMKLLQRQDWHQLKELLAGSVKDFRLLIDYIKSDERFSHLPVGVLGMSLGAIHSLEISAVDERIEFLVSVFPPVQSISPVVDTISPLSVAEMISAPCLLLISDQDVWYSLADGKKLFEMLACKEKSLNVLSTPHELGYSKAETVVQWIQKNTRAIK